MLCIQYWLTTYQGWVLVSLSHLQEFSRRFRRSASRAFCFSFLWEKFKNFLNGLTFEKMGIQFSHNSRESLAGWLISSRHPIVGIRKKKRYKRLFTIYWTTCKNSCKHGTLKKPWAPTHTSIWPNQTQWGGCVACVRSMVGRSEKDQNTKIKPFCGQEKIETRILRLSFRNSLFPVQFILSKRFHIHSFVRSTFCNILLILLILRVSHKIPRFSYIQYLKNHISRRFHRNFSRYGAIDR